MILAGQLLLDDGRGRCRVAPGIVRIDGDQISEVVEGEIPQTADCGGPSALISPGFIDAHLHLPQFDMIGAHGIPLLDWLIEFTFPAEVKWKSRICQIHDCSIARTMPWQRNNGRLRVRNCSP